jgi:DHA1 family multidrug resistance protein-like MFS transporter
MRHYPNVVVLAIANLTGMLGYSMFTPVMSIYLKDIIGATWLLLGLFTTTFALMRAILQPVMGRLSDRIGRKKAIVPALFAYSGIGYLYSTARTGVEFVGYRIAQGISSSTLWPASDALIADTVPSKERGRALGAVYMTYQIGNILGLVLGGIVAYIWGVMEIFYFTAIFAFFGAILSLVFLKEPSRKAAKNEDSSVGSQRSTGKNNAAQALAKKGEASSKQQASFRPGARRIVLSIGVTSLLLNAAFAMMEFIISLLIWDILGGTLIDLTIIWGITAILSALSTLIGGSFADKYSRRRIIIYVTIIAAVYWILMIFTMSLMYLAVLEFIFTFAAGLVGPSIMALVADLTPPEKRGRTFGWLGTFNDTGLAFGPLMAGLLLDYLQLNMGLSEFPSMQLLFLVNAAITAAAILVAIAGVKELKAKY